MSFRPFTQPLFRVRTNGTTSPTRGATKSNFQFLGCSHTRNVFYKLSLLWPLLTPFATLLRNIGSYVKPLPIRQIILSIPFTVALALIKAEIIGLAASLACGVVHHKRV